jgi:peptide/nickel transport system permease protein
MSTLERVARRLGLALSTVLVVLTVMFAVTAFFPDPPNSLFAPQAPPPEGSPRDATTPLVERYVTWLVKFTTLDWSYAADPFAETAVSDRVIGALGVTATYLVPALLVSYVGGVAVGVRAALDRDSGFDYLSRSLAYVGFAVPTFFVAMMAWFFLGWERGWTPRYDPARPLFTQYNLLRLVIPALSVVVTTTAIQLRHARSEVLAELREEYVKLARSQGAGDRRLGRYALRNAAATVLSLFVAELLGLILLSVIALESVLQIPGFGELLVDAARDRDPPLVLGATFVTLVIGVTAGLLRDGVVALLRPDREGAG